MTDRPILFSGPMVRALLERRKTQTRRVLKPQPIWEEAAVNEFSFGAGWSWGRFGRWSDAGKFGEEVAKDIRIQPGDRLWVREAWCWAARGGYDAREDGGEVWYRATDEGECEGPWKPSIHMPRVASRLTLTVTDVRVQRLQDISEEDARAEGADPIGLADIVAPTYIAGFARIWAGIHAPSLTSETCWGRNPWVAAYTFTVGHRNIDAGGSHV